MTSKPLSRCIVCQEAVEMGSLCVKHDAGFRVLIERAEQFAASAHAVWVMVCEPLRSEGGRADSHLVAWRGEALDAEVNSVGSMRAEDYGLDDVPGPGIWVFEGRVRVEPHRCNHPQDPEEWDTSLDYTGVWRRPTDAELRAAAEPQVPAPDLPKSE
jgi:hypothetical protein